VLSSLGVAPDDFLMFHDVDYGIIDSIADGWSATVKNGDGTVDPTFDISDD
jgi:hypothetical protein